MESAVVKFEYDPKGKPPTQQFQQLITDIVGQGNKILKVIPTNHWGNSAGQLFVCEATIIVGISGVKADGLTKSISREDLLRFFQWAHINGMYRDLNLNPSNYIIPFRAEVGLVAIFDKWAKTNL